MAFSATRADLIRELIGGVIAVAVAIAAAVSITADFLLASNGAEAGPALLLAFTPFSAVAYPVLATTVGYALARGSATSAGFVPQKMYDLYKGLAKSASHDFEARVSGVTIEYLTRAASYLDRNQRAYASSSHVRHTILNVASELRHLADQLRNQDPRIAAQYSDVAASLLSTVHRRRLRLEVDGVNRAGSLEAGRNYALHLVFVPDDTDRPDRPSQVTTRALPADFGSRSELELTLHLLGDNLSFGSNALPVTLPQWGDSTHALTSVAVANEGPCTLRIVVTTASELEILQTYLYTFTAAASPTAQAGL